MRKPRFLSTAAENCGSSRVRKALAQLGSRSRFLSLHRGPEVRAPPFGLALFYILPFSQLNFVRAAVNKLERKKFRQQ